MTENFEKIKSFIAGCGIENIDCFIEKCTAFKSFLYEENEKHNLTRITDEFEFWNRHIADSASIALFYREQLSKPISLADVGCGAGFPSVPLALAFPGLNVTAIDSTGKKTAFVSLAAKILDIKNLRVVTGRARELKMSRMFDIVTARAVGEPLSIFKEVKSWLKSDGRIILYQTPQKMSEEPAALNKLTCGHGFAWSLTKPFNLPGGENRIFLEGSYERH